MAGDQDDLETRWRDWHRGAEDGPAPGAAPQTGSAPAGRLRPPSVRTAALVVAVLALLALGVGVVAGLGGRDTPSAVLPGAGPLPAGPSSGASTAPQAERDLGALATATADGTAVSGVDAGGAIVSYLPSNVLDGDPVTAWRTDGPGDGRTLTLDFSREVTVTRVGLAVGEPAAAATGDSAATRHGRDVHQVTWTVGESSLDQQLDPTRLDTQLVRLPQPVTTRSLTLRLDRTVPGPVATDDFAAVTQVVVLGDG